MFATSPRTGERGVCSRLGEEADVEQRATLESDFFVVRINIFGTKKRIGLRPNAEDDAPRKNARRSDRASEGFEDVGKGV